MVWFKIKKINKRNRLFFIPLTALILIAIAALLFGPSAKYEVKAGSCVFKAAGALKAKDQYRGLSKRKHLDADRGMLFLFQNQADQNFVMRDMNFPLDIIFIKNHRVINLYNNLPPAGDGPLTSYHSGAPVDAVLEITAGRSQGCGIGVGSEVLW